MATTLGGALGLVPWWVVCGSPVVTVVSSVFLLGIAMLYQSRVPARAQPASVENFLAALLAAWFALSAACFFLLAVFGLGLGILRLTAHGLGFFEKTISVTPWQSGFWSSLLIALWFVPASTALSARDVNRIIFPSSSSSDFSWRLLWRTVPKGVMLISAIGLGLVAWLLPRLLLNDEAGLLDGFLVTFAALLAGLPGIAVVDVMHPARRAPVARRAPADTISDSDLDVRRGPRLHPRPFGFSTADPSAPRERDRVRELFERAGFEIAPVESRSRLTERLDFVASRDALVVPVEVVATVDARSFDTALVSSALATASRVWAASSSTAVSQPMLVVVTEGPPQPTMKLGAVTVVGVDTRALERVLALGADGARAAAELLHLSMARETS